MMLSNTPGALSGLGEQVKTGILLWQDGNCYNTSMLSSEPLTAQSAMANSTRVPCWCLVWPWADSCHPVGSLPASTSLPIVAPQTENQMTVGGAWTPDEASAWSRYVAQQVRAAEDNARATSSGTGGTSTPPGDQPKDNNTALWVLGGIAATMFLLMAVKK